MVQYIKCLRSFTMWNLEFSEAVGREGRVLTFVALPRIGANVWGISVYKSIRKSAQPHHSHETLAPNVAKYPNIQQNCLTSSYCSCRFLSASMWAERRQPVGYQHYWYGTDHVHWWVINRCCLISFRWSVVIDLNPNIWLKANTSGNGMESDWRTRALYESTLQLE